MLFRYVLVMFFLVIFPCLLSGQELVENDPNSPSGLVYFLRGKNHAWSYMAFSAIVDGNRVCKLNNRRYSSCELEPGSHDFKVQVGGKKGKRKAEIITINIEAGKTYYLQMVMHANFWWSNVYPQEITRNGALRLLESDKLKIDPFCGEDMTQDTVPDAL